MEMSGIESMPFESIVNYTIFVTSRRSFPSKPKREAVTKGRICHSCSFCNDKGVYQYQCKSRSVKEDLQICPVVNLSTMCSMRPEVEIHEINEEELLMRYGLPPQPPPNDDIIIHRPDVEDIVARYSSAVEAAEDIIVVSHPNDDDVVRRYAVPCMSIPENRLSPSVHPLPVTISSDLNTVEIIGGVDLMGSRVMIKVEEGSPSCSDSATAGQDSGSNDSGYSDSLCENSKAKIEVNASKSNNELRFTCDSDMTDDDALVTDESDVISDELDLEDTDRIGVAEAGCPSHHNHNITVYNLCCDKSALPMDATERDFLSTRSLLLYNPPLPGDSRGKVMKSKRSKDAGTFKKRFLQIVKAFETAAHDVDCLCISAKKSLRKNETPVNVSKTANLFVESLTPLINKERTLLRKIRAYVT